MTSDPPRRLLVTGGAGFIGSHVVDLLIARGHEVTALDDLSTGSDSNLGHLRDHPAFRFVRGDAGDPATLRRSLEGIDGVFHLAASVGVRLILKERVRAIDNIVLPTSALLREAAERRVRVVLASTSEVYGRGMDAPFREEQDAVIGNARSARWSYACAKLLGEFEAFAHREERGLAVSVARIFNTVGPRQTGQYGMVLPSLVAQARAGGPMTVFGDGLQTRSFCHVEDTARGLALLMDRDEALGEIVNMGSDRELSILALAELVRARVRPDCAIACVPYEQAYGQPVDDMRRRVPSIEKAKRLLGWSPARSLEEVIDALAKEALP